MCVVTLKNDGHEFSNSIAPGDAVEIKVTVDQEKQIFKGEVVSIEPSYKMEGGNRCVVRAYHKAHRMSRGRKSKTFQDKTDNDVIKAVGGAYVATVGGT